MDPFANVECIMDNVNVDCPACQSKVWQVVKSINGVYQLKIDGEEGTATLCGRVDPYRLLPAMAANTTSTTGNHANVKIVNLSHPSLSNIRNGGSDGYRSNHDYGSHNGYDYGGHYGHYNGGYNYGAATIDDPYMYPIRRRGLPEPHNYYRNNNFGYPMIRGRNSYSATDYHPFYDDVSDCCNPYYGQAPSPFGYRY